MYKAADLSELSFSKGDTIFLKETDAAEWGFGTKDGKEGWFPLKFVKSMDIHVEITARKSKK